MKAIEYQIFDDLLIGNFMKTTLHNMTSLYEGDFNFYVAKYGDNGKAESIEELETYFDEYKRRIAMKSVYEKFSENIADLAKRLLPRNKDSILFSAAKKVHYYIKRV